MSNIPKSIKKQEHESFLKRKLLREYYTSQLKDPDLVCLYTDLEKYPLSQVITSKKILRKDWEKNSEVV